ncbi:sensor domain-containing diguanylate cyclase [Eubacterium sp. 1001713B170207_170306_E7]|uniref:diguanylate cyclase domain-containing protein n=1 Tax=Eubacterium sp. 1001713B170207_170306_E7 TaxID=2787097 RepID=UPI00189AD7BC
MKQLQRKSLYRYAAALFAFLCYLGLCLAVFFVGIQRAVEQNTQVILADNVARQSSLMVSLMDIEFETLNGLAAYIGSQSESGGSQALMSAMTGESKFHRISYFDQDGTGYSNEGPVSMDARNRDFFKKSIQGQDALSEPYESHMDSDAGQEYVALSVPVYRDGAVTGVLVGSYDVRHISQIPFSDLYSGSGYVYIVNKDGKVIAMDSRYSGNGYSVDFYDYYSRFTFGHGASLDSVREDFDRGSSGVHLLKNSSDALYLAYEPIGYNGWFLCYVVPQESAQQSYAFIREYEVALSLFVVAGLIILLSVMQYINVKDRKQLVAKAETDAMTGLLNAVSTREAINGWLSGEQTRGMQALIMLDIDKFKDVNDTYGHAVGDAALRRSAELLRQHFRESDVVGRVGGDEFIIFMKNIPDGCVVEKQLSRLCEAFHRLHIAEAPGLRLTCSAGAALVPGDGMDFESLYKKADEAMYRVKRGSRDGFHIYKEPDDKEEGTP